MKRNLVKNKAGSYAGEFKHPHQILIDLSAVLFNFHSGSGSFCRCTVELCAVIFLPSYLLR